MDVLQQYITYPDWMTGFHGHAAGFTRDQNPFKDDTGGIPYQAWDQGWCTAERERKHKPVDITFYRAEFEAIQ